MATRKKGLALSITGQHKLNRLAKNLRVKKNVTDPLSEAISAIAFLAERGMKLALTKPPTRAILTGFLRASVRVTKFTGEEAIIEPTAKYAKYVHDGTKFMRARRFIPAGLSIVGNDIERVKKKFGVDIKLNLIRGL